jgi:hypothetical protein
MLNMISLTVLINGYRTMYDLVLYLIDLNYVVNAKEPTSTNG